MAVLFRAYSLSRRWSGERYGNDLIRHVSLQCEQVGCNEEFLTGNPHGQPQGQWRQGSVAGGREVRRIGNIHLCAHRYCHISTETCYQRLKQMRESRHAIDADPSHETQFHNHICNALLVEDVTWQQSVLAYVQINSNTAP